MQYSEITLYGINQIIKDYARFPKFLPLPCHISHGWTPESESLASDLEVDKPIMFVFSKRRLNAWKNADKSLAYISGAPFIHYKNLHKITRRPDALGTIAFPSHSTDDIKSSFNVQKYCELLKQLPQKFHPISICLFWPDYKATANIYRKNGFKVTTAGPHYKKGLGFVKNFYKILTKHRYATSNDVGSYTFYSVDLGIPFFLLGEIPLNVNTASNKDMGQSDKMNQKYFGRQALKMFQTGPIETISAKQAEYVADEMGVNDCLSTQEMNHLLWKTFKKNPHPIRGTIAYWVISVLLFLGLVGVASRLREAFQKFLKKGDK